MPTVPSHAGQKRAKGHKEAQRDHCVDAHEVAGEEARDKAVDRGEVPYWQQLPPLQ